LAHGTERGKSVELPSPGARGAFRFVERTTCMVATIAASPLPPAPTQRRCRRFARHGRLIGMALFAACIAWRSPGAIATRIHPASAFVPTARGWEVGASAWMEARSKPAFTMPAVPDPFAEPANSVTLAARLDNNGMEEKIHANLLDNDAREEATRATRYNVKAIAAAVKRRRLFAAARWRSRDMDTPRNKAELRLVVFDFDLTLSVFHVSKVLAGVTPPEGEFRVPPPYAVAELGQLRRLRELDTELEIAAAGGFAALAFGGFERVKAIDSMLRELRTAGVKLYVCTKGLVGPVQLILEDLGLRHHFLGIYGNLGEAYGRYEYDEIVTRGPTAPAERRLLGKPAQGGWLSKDLLVMRLRKQHGIESRDQACLVEDDPEEIERAEWCSRPLYVEPVFHGMGAEHFDWLKRAAGVVEGSVRVEGAATALVS